MITTSSTANDNDEEGGDSGGGGLDGRGKVEVRQGDKDDGDKLPLLSLSAMSLLVSITSPSATSPTRAPSFLLSTPAAGMGKDDDDDEAAGEERYDGNEDATGETIFDVSNCNTVVLVVVAADEDTADVLGEFVVVVVVVLVVLAVLVFLFRAPPTSMFTAMLEELSAMGVAPLATAAFRLRDFCLFGTTTAAAVVFWSLVWPCFDVPSGGDTITTGTVA